MGDILREAGAQSITEVGGIVNRDDLSNGQKRKENLENKRKTRRLVACKRCHMLKVKCVPAFQEEPEKTCLRCLNANEVCEFEPYQSRKRRRRRGRENSEEPQKIPESEMEEISSLKAQVGNLQENILRLQEEKASLIQQKCSSDGTYEQGLSSYTSSPSAYIQSGELEKELCLLLEGSNNVTVTLADELKKILEAMTEAARRRQKSDLIEEGFLTWDEAKERLELYRNGLYKNFPFVDIPDLDVGEFHKRYRNLFNTIMAVSNFLCGRSNVKNGALIDVVATENLAFEVLVLGNKSVELLKCLILTSLWHNNPLMLRKKKRAHIFSFLALHMLHDVGFIGRPSVKGEESVFNKNTDRESMRLTMAVLLSHASISIVLRRTMAIKWTPFVEECCSCLEKSTDVKDNTIALYLRIVQELERIHNTVRAPLPERVYAERIAGELHRQLNLIKPKIPQRNHVLLGYFYAIESYLLGPFFESHERGIDDAVDPGSQFNLSTFKSLEACTRACTSCLEEYASLTVDEMAALPTTHSLGIYYCVSMIFRMKSLILKSPAYLNRNIVPIKAMMSIRQILRQMLSGTSLYNFNFTLRKNSFILYLCCKSYTMHVQDLMRTAKDPNFAKTILLLKRDLFEIERLNKVDSDVSGGLLTTESGEHYSSPVCFDVSSLPFPSKQKDVFKENDKASPLFNSLDFLFGSKVDGDTPMGKDIHTGHKENVPARDRLSSLGAPRNVHRDDEVASQQNSDFPTIQSCLQDILSFSPSDSDNFFNKGGFVYDQHDEIDNPEGNMCDLRPNYFFDLL